MCVNVCTDEQPQQPPSEYYDDAADNDEYSSYRVDDQASLVRR